MRDYDGRGVEPGSSREEAESMSRHWGRDDFFIAGEGLSSAPPYMSGAGHSCIRPGSPAFGHVDVVNFKFGRMFERCRGRQSAETPERMLEMLLRLGTCMNSAAAHPAPSDGSEDSDIPAGYTYLGQFIAHEVTFNQREEFTPCDSAPASMRSPHIDLDSLYGAGPDCPVSAHLYRDHARLKEGRTTPLPDLNKEFDNDLPRGAGAAGNPKEALIGDPRNDENLTVAQTHLAFIKFHNKVVDALEADGCPPRSLFPCARKTVAQHFQWLILEDYLPRLLDPSVLNLVRNRPPAQLRVEDEDGVFMPLEFSAAAFRVGHSMIRDRYEWNAYHCSEGPTASGPAHLFQLFKLTNFSGDLDGAPTLKSDWVVDWRRFYDFESCDPRGNRPRPNMARKIDTIFDIRLDKVPGYPHLDMPVTHRSLTARNLLRGFALGLPTGEEVAEQLGVEPISEREVVSGPHAEVLGDPAFRGMTPLWYYILKEAELNGGSRLGPVGSSIIAETLIGLIRKSPYSILETPDWQPFPARRTSGGGRRFEMTDLLNFADCVDPIGRHFREIYSE